MTLKYLWEIQIRSWTEIRDMNNDIIFHERGGKTSSWRGAEMAFEESNDILFGAQIFEESKGGKSRDKYKTAQELDTPLVAPQLLYMIVASAQANHCCLEGANYCNRGLKFFLSPSPFFFSSLPSYFPLPAHPLSFSSPSLSLLLLLMLLLLLLFHLLWIPLCSLADPFWPDSRTPMFLGHRGEELGRVRKKSIDMAVYFHFSFAFTSFGKAFVCSDIQFSHL